MNVKLMRRLRAAAGDYVPLAELGGDLNQVRRELDAWEAFGYVLERHPLLGVAYRAASRRLCPDEIEHELGTRWIGARIAVWDRVGSTNDLAARAAALSRSNAGLVVLAEEQTAGRGRRGRRWSSPPRTSILMSVVLDPPDPIDTVGFLTALGAVAVAEVVEAWTNQTARIKWPNDVRVDRQKVAGILVERSGATVLGIGLNVLTQNDQFPSELADSVTSLALLRDGRAPGQDRLPELDRSSIARALIQAIDAWYDRGLLQGPRVVHQAWSQRCEALGRLIRIRTLDGEIEGTLLAADLDEGPRLQLHDDRVLNCPVNQVIEFVY